MSSEMSATLAKQINDALAESNRLAESAVIEAARAGKLMIEAKKQVPHGMWGQWIQQNCHMTDRNARRYMQLARELPKLEDARRAEVMTLPIREAVLAIAQKKSPPPVAADQNGHAVSVFIDEAHQAETTAAANAQLASSTDLTARIRQAMHKLTAPTRDLTKLLWQYLARKFGRHQQLMTEPRR